MYANKYNTYIHSYTYDTYTIHTLQGGGHFLTLLFQTKIAERGNMDDQKSDILRPKSRGGVPWLGHRSITFFTFVALQ